MANPDRDKVTLTPEQVAEIPAVMDHVINGTNNVGNNPVTIAINRKRASGLLSRFSLAKATLELEMKAGPDEEYEKYFLNERTRKFIAQAVGQEISGMEAIEISEQGYEVDERFAVLCGIKVAMTAHE